MRLSSYCSYLLAGIGLFLFSRPGRWVSAGASVGALLCTAGAGLLAVGRLGISRSIRRHHHQVSSILDGISLPSENSGAFFVAARYTAGRVEGGNFMPVEELIGFCTVHRGALFSSVRKRSSVYSIVHAGKDTNSATIEQLVVAHKFKSAVPSLLVQRTLYLCAHWKVRTIVLFMNTLQQDERMQCQVELERLGWEMFSSQTTRSPTSHRLQIFRKKTNTNFDLAKYKIPHQVHVLKLGQPMSEPTSLPQTERLLRSVLRSIQDPVAGTMVGLAFQQTFRSVCFALSRKHTGFPGDLEALSGFYEGR